MSEEWRDVPDYEGYYQVSNLGRVRSLDRTVPNGRGHTKRLKGRVLKQTNYGTNPYQTVTLSLESKHKLCTVHKLVAVAFLGPCPSNDHEVCHGPGGKLDNRLSNLHYGTRTQNQLDRYRDGTRGNRPVRRGDGKEYISAAVASKETGIHPSTISAVCNKHVSRDGKRN